MTDAIAHITVGVADLGRALALWRDTFGFEVAARRAGPDPGLGRLWNIDAERIADQAMLRSPGATAGCLHLVQFKRATAPVRGGAGATDLGPKNLDVYCHDINARVAELAARGWSFRSRVVDYRLGDIHASEVQMPGPDETNIVLVEVAGQAMPVSPQGYCGITSFVVIVREIDPEVDFYRRVFGFEQLLRHRITGAEIEEMINLPAATGVEMSVLGRKQQRFGRVELIRYDGPPGTDRFALARAPALGSLHCAFRVASVEVALARDPAAARGAIRADTLFASGQVGVLTTPQGLRIEVFEG